METILIPHNYTEKSFSSMSYRLANYLANLGHTVVFISYRPYFEQPKELLIGKGKIKIYSWTSKNRPTGLKDFIWFTKIYLKYKPKTVLCHFAASNIIGIIATVLSINKCKVFNYNHTLLSQTIADTGYTFKTKLLVLRKRVFYKLFVNQIICPSQMAKDDLEINFKTNKGIVVLNPLPDRFIENNFESNHIIISSLGRIDPTKNIVNLVKAFAIYTQNNPKTKLKLRIAGNGSDAVAVKNEINNNNLIEFIGELSYDKVDDFLKNSHYTIIPSMFDAFNVVGIESLMNKRPLLISKTTGLTNYLTDGENSYTFDANIDQIIKTFERVENNFSDYDKMANNARKTYLEKFTIEKYCTKMTELLLKNSQ